MTRDKIFGGKIVSINKFGVPGFALIATVVVTLFLIITGSIQLVAEIIVAMFLYNWIITHVVVMMEDVRQKIEEAGAVLYLTRSPLQLLPGLSTTGEVPRNTDFEEVSIALQTIEDGPVKEDTIADDISLSALKVRSIMAGHCTGFRVQAELYQTFKATEGNPCGTTEAQLSV